MSNRRFAIYYAPNEDNPLSRAASAWLASGAEKWPGATDSPRMYGFHATLKPPFRLADGTREDELRFELERFARSCRPFHAPRLRLASLDSFIALVLSAPSCEFQDLADAAVREFDRFRAPAPAHETERRRKAKLNPRQLELLDLWGYPYVFDEWRFHMTLTGSLSPVTRDQVQAWLAPEFEPHCRDPFRVDSVCLFEQPDIDEQFRCVMRAPLS